MIRGFSLLSVAVLLAVLSMSPCEAQQSVSVAPSEPAGYRDAIDEAVREFSAKNFDESRALFARAHDIYPNARSLRGLGMVEFERRNYGECIRYLEEALGSTIRPLDGELRVDTDKLLARAEGFVARLALEVNPGVANVLVDGVPVELRQGGTLTLQVGDHTIEVQAEKFKPERRQLSVRGGEEQKLTIVLKQDLGPASVPVDEPRPIYKNPWLWTAVSVVVVGAGVGVAFLLQPEPEERVGPVTTANTPTGVALNTLWSRP